MRYLPQIKSTQSLPQHNCVCPSSLEGVAMSNSWIDSLNDLWDCSSNERLDYREEAPPSLQYPPCEILFQGQPSVAASSQCEQGHALRCSWWAKHSPRKQKILAENLSPLGRNQKLCLPYPVMGSSALGTGGGERNETLVGADTELPKAWAYTAASRHLARTILLASNSTTKAFSTFLTPFPFPFPPPIPLILMTSLYETLYYLVLN